MSAPSKLSIVGLSKSFRRPDGNRIEILSDVSLEVANGEFISLVGASGCGKTTLLRIIDGLIQPSAGATMVDGRRTAGAGPDRAFVFQADSLLPWRRLIDNVAIGMELRGVHRSERHDRAAEFINLVGLRGFESHFPSQLSGGMRQRANLARALVMDPEILLMDEPFAALDAQTREIMQSELLRIWNQSKKTVVFVTHQIDEAVYLSDRVVVLATRPGRVREDVSIGLPRPRTLESKRTPEFVKYTDRIWKLIEADVRESISREIQLELQSG